jgi:protein-L-isoaspartate(D-aspartate) O-methyltransferase
MLRYLSALFIILGILLLPGCSGASPEVEQPQHSQTSISPDEDVIESSEADYHDARQRMVEFGIIAFGIEDQDVIDVMGHVPRHQFVREAHVDLAYANHPLPIGYGQTISQPFIVALMTQELDLEPGEKVLEIGTGSGYQAAILAELQVEVYTIEIIKELAQEAFERLRHLGYADIQLRNGDGYYGWSEHAPFDAIIVTAAPDHVPQPLIDQLASGGVMVVPVGPIGGIQELWRITKSDSGEIHTTSLGGVRFVPFTRTGEPTDQNNNER